MSENAKRTPRHDGWTDARREAFLAHLAVGHSVAAACRIVGMGKPSAYRLRAADPGFALAWGCAQEQGATAIEDSARLRAIQGWLEPVTYRGRTITFAERFDQRLLLKLLDHQMRREDRAERREERIERRAAKAPPAPPAPKSS